MAIISARNDEVTVPAGKDAVWELLLMISMYTPLPPFLLDSLADPSVQMMVSAVGRELR